MRSLKILSFASRVLALGCVTAIPEVHAQNLTRLASEYGIVGSLSGSQMNSSVAFNSTGGWVVWQDNISDGDGLGISARRLNSGLSGDLNVFRVNQVGVGEQENPQVAMLNDGGAVFVWQGGRVGFQKVYARFMSSDLTFRTGDVLVNTFTNEQQIHPSVAVLANGNVMISWQSYDQDGDMFGVYGKIFAPNGSPVGAEFQVNQNGLLNQEDPRVAALAGGNFLVSWISEQSGTAADTNNPALQFTVGVYGRLYNSSGTALGNEFRLDNGNVCANPFVVGTPAGGFVAAWSQRDTGAGGSSNRWDVFSRGFDANGAASGAAARINSTVIGDQAGPFAAVSGTNVLFVWTSMGQDGSQEGVYGQYATLVGTPVGGEVRINTTTVSKQMQPAVASDGNGRFLAVWSSFIGLSEGFDLFAQRFTGGASSGLIEPPAPYVFAVNATSLNVTWPEMDGYSVAFYEVYIDGETNPVVVNGLQKTFTNLTASSTHTFRLRYQLTDGQRSPLSTPATGTTWGVDQNGDQLPDDWQAAQWGANASNWPSATTDSDGDGASNAMEFLAGTNPNNSASVLRTRLNKTPSGFVFSWNTQLGMVYQLQSATNLNNWQNVGSPRFAHGTVDSVLFAAGNQSVFYRVICLR